MKTGINSERAQELRTWYEEILRRNQEPQGIPPEIQAVRMGRPSITLEDNHIRAIQIALLGDGVLIRQLTGNWLPPLAENLPKVRQHYYRVWTPTVMTLVEYGVGTLSGSATITPGFTLGTRFDLSPRWRLRPCI